jgi:hypothetical protein
MLDQALGVVYLYKDFRGHEKCRQRDEFPIQWLQKYILVLLLAE